MFRRRHDSNDGREWEGGRRSWFIRSCLTPDAEFLRIEKIRRIDFVEGAVSRGIAFLRTSFTPPAYGFSLLFDLFFVPELPYHNDLYDTRVANGVKARLAESKGLDKTYLSTGVH